MQWLLNNEMSGQAAGNGEYANKREQQCATLQSLNELWRQLRKKQLVC